MTEDQPTNTQPPSIALQVRYDMEDNLPILAVNGEFHTLSPDAAEAIAKGLVYAAAMSRRHAAAELN